MSPSGTRVAAEFRAEIVTVPVEKGESAESYQYARSAERSPSWSPDGKTIAYLLR